MKIESLHFKNINSLKGEHEVYFDKSPLSSGGLFAITGPTGSGKSTLLDAICLALYGRTPRVPNATKSKISQDGSILTRHQKEAYAKVKFSCKAGSFIATWSISTNRAGKLREYDMDLWDLQKETSFSEKKSEVLVEIPRLIGLSYDQFVKSVLLSQGEFATLLKSNEKDRSELLEKITSTSIYRQIGKLVYEKHNIIKSEISSQKTIIEDLNQKLLSEEDEVHKQKVQLQLETQEHLQQQQLTLFQKDLDQLNIKEQLDQDLKNETKTLENFSQSLEDFISTHDEKLKQHAKTLDFEEDLLQHNTLNDQIQTQLQNVERLKTSKDQFQQEIEGLQKTIGELLNTTINENEAEAELDTFLETYQALKYQRSLKRNDYTNKLETLKKALEPTQLKFKNQAIDEFNVELDERLKEILVEINALDISITKGTNLAELIRSETSFLNQLKNAKHENKTIEEISHQIEKLQLQIKTETTINSKFPELISTKKEEISKIEKSLKQLETEKENQNLRLEVDELRKKLEDSQPCPVCGSTTHPYAAHLPVVDSKLDLKLEKEKSKLFETTKELANLNAELTSKSKRLKELNTELKTLKEKLETKNNNFANAYKDVISRVENQKFSEQEKATELFIRNIEKLKTLQEELNALETAGNSLEELKIIGREGFELKEKMLRLYDGEDLAALVSKLKKGWISCQSNLKSTKASLVEEKKHLEDTQSNLQRLLSSLEPKIKASAFSSISEANSSRMKATDFQTLSQQKQDLINKKQIQTEKLKGLKDQLKKLKFEVYTNRNEAEQALEKLKKEHHLLKKELEELRRELKNHSENKKQITSLENSIKKKLEANKKWEILNQLIGDAEGHKFNKFAQDLSLQRLIYLGNNRLKHLNDRYQLHRYLPHENKEHLYVIDQHMGGIRRSVKTLSGGETFLMSLALALGLSDLASKNVEINSLFIDEGFGTLDPETLDTTLDTLEKLQAESNKTIGIISHVSTLKERIQTQVVLDRNAQGYSQLSVIG